MIITTRRTVTYFPASALSMRFDGDDNSEKPNSSDISGGVILCLSIVISQTGNLWIIYLHTHKFDVYENKSSPNDVRHADYTIIISISASPYRGLQLNHKRRAPAAFFEKI